MKRAWVFETPMAAGGSSSSSNGAASRGGRQDIPIPTGCCSSFFEYETPKVVTVQNVPLGILRLVLTCPAPAKKISMCSHRAANREFLSQMFPT